MNRLQLLMTGILASVSFAFVPLDSGWHSSGGELFQLNKNPWFVTGKSGGVTEVRYCIQIDASAMSASAPRVQNAVQGAFDYWKSEFSQNGQGVIGRQGFAALATQNFIFQPSCDPKTTDIRFLFGYGTLKQEEIDYLVDPKKYVGVTVRTDYELTQLKGKGFVYISGDLGANSYQNPGDLIAHAWENDRLLQLALIHEVGHIMGIPHTGTGLMSEVFPQQLLHKRFSQFYIKNAVQSFLNPPMNFEVCTLNGSFNPEFFKIIGPVLCLGVSGTYSPNGDLIWNIATREKEGAPLKPLGAIKARLSNTSVMGAKPSVVIQLPQEQQVYSIQERLLNGYMLGPIYQEGTAKGSFRLTGSLDPIELQIELHPDSITMVGVVNGRPIPVLLYSPPSLLKMLFPIEGIDP